MTDKKQSAFERALDILPEEPESKEISTTVVSPDDDNIDVDAALVDLYTRAIDAFEEQVNNASIVEPRYAARNMEVAKGLLDSAMEAIKLRQQKEIHKDKIQLATDKGSPTLNQTNILINGTQKEVLKELLSGNNQLRYERRETVVIDEDVKGEK